MFCEKSVLKNFTKFTVKHLCQNLFFNKVAGLSPTVELNPTVMSPWEFCEIFLREPFLQNISGDCFCNYRSIARHMIATIIITIIIITLINIIIDQIVTSVFLIQVKSFFSLNTFPIIFITITISHSNILQPEMLKCFCLLLRLLHQNFKHYMHQHPYPKCFLH